MKQEQHHLQQEQHPHLHVNNVQPVPLQQSDHQNVQHVQQEHGHPLEPEVVHPVQQVVQLVHLQREHVHHVKLDMVYQVENVMHVDQ